MVGEESGGHSVVSTVALNSFQQVSETNVEFSCISHLINFTAQQGQS